MRKNYFIRKMVMLISLFFCSMIAVFATVPEQVLVAGITGTYADANGLYTKQSVRSAAGKGNEINQYHYSSSYDRYYWQRTSGANTYYIYLLQYSSTASYYWDIDINDFDDTIGLFFSTNPTGELYGGYRVDNYEVIPQSPDQVSGWVGAAQGFLGEGTVTVTVPIANIAPIVTTQAVTSFTTSTATGNGNITNLGVPNPTQYGVVWSRSTNPTVALTTKTAQGAIAVTGAFTSSITGLSANTTYYVKAYATNTVETSYGSEVSFTTVAAATSSYSGPGSWSNSASWSEGIPGAVTTATILGDVTLNSTTTVKAITISTGSSLTVAAGQTLDVTQGISNNGTITNEGTIIGAIVVPIEFDENGGSLVSDILQDYNTALTLPTPTKNGNAFLGWFSDIILTTPFNSTTMPLNGLTLYAEWQVVTSITNNVQEVIAIYPNPATDGFTINVGSQPTVVSISDLGGVPLLSQQVVDNGYIDISGLPLGTYMVHANGYTTKLVKK